MAEIGTIEHFPNGTVVATGPAVEVVQLLTLRSALRLEMRGLRLSRGRSALRMAKAKTGLKTNDRNEQIKRLEAMIEGARACVIHVKAHAEGDEL